MKIKKEKFIKKVSLMLRPSEFKAIENIAINNGKNISVVIREMLLERLK